MTFKSQVRTGGIMYYVTVERVGPDDVETDPIEYYPTRREAMARAKAEAQIRGSDWDWSVDKVRVLDQDKYGNIFEEEPLVRWSSYAGREELR